MFAEHQKVSDAQQGNCSRYTDNFIVNAPHSVAHVLCPEGAAPDVMAQQPQQHKKIWNRKSVGIGCKKRRAERRASGRETKAAFEEWGDGIDEVARVVEGLVKQVIDENTDGNAVFRAVTILEADNTPSTISHRDRHLRAKGERYTLSAGGPPTTQDALPFPRREPTVTKRPTNHSPPKQELNQRVDELTNYGELFKEGALERLLDAANKAGDIEKAAARGGDLTDAQGQLRYPEPVILQWNDYSDIAQEVLAAGFTFEIDADGRPHIVTLQPLSSTEEDINTVGIIEIATMLGLEDKRHYGYWNLEHEATASPH
jgi:hypothetical protein